MKTKFSPYFSFLGGFQFLKIFPIQAFLWGVSIFENFPPLDFSVSFENLCPKRVDSNLPIFRSFFLSGIGSNCGNVFPALRADFFDGAKSGPRQHHITGILALAGVKPKIRTHVHVT